MEHSWRFPWRQDKKPSQLWRWLARKLFGDRLHAEGQAQEGWRRNWSVGEFSFTAEDNVIRRLVLSTLSVSFVSSAGLSLARWCSTLWPLFILLLCVTLLQNATELNRSCTSATDRKRKSSQWHLRLCTWEGNQHWQPRPLSGAWACRVDACVAWTDWERCLHTFNRGRIPGWQPSPEPRAQASVPFPRRWWPRLSLNSRCRSERMV